MFLILILFYEVLSLWPNRLMDTQCMWKYFQRCSYAGKNTENVLFECFDRIILIPITSLDLDTNIKLQIGLGGYRWLHDQLFFQLQLGVLTIEKQQENQTKPLLTLDNVAQFGSTRIDQSLMVISVLQRTQEKSKTCFNISLLFVEPEQEKYYEIFTMKFDCFDRQLNIGKPSMMLYYDQTRKSLVIVERNSKGIVLIEFSLVNRKFRILQQLHFTQEQLQSLVSSVLEQDFLFLFFQNELLVYCLDENKLKQLNIFDFSIYQRVLIVRDLRGQSTQYVIVIRDSQLQLVEISKTNNNIFVQINTQNIDSPLFAFLIQDNKIVLIDYLFTRFIIDLSTKIHYKIECFVPCDCQDIIVIEDMMKQTDLRKFNKSYNQVSKKGDVFKWIYHPGSLKKQRMKITASFDFDKTIQRIYTVSQLGIGEFLISLNKPHILPENTSFYYELVLLSDTIVDDLVFSISEEDLQDFNYNFIVYFSVIIGVCCVILRRYQKPIIERIKFWHRTKQLERKYITQYSFQPSILVFGETECLICLGVFVINQKVSQPSCGHTFHYNCFKDWMIICQEQIKCPTCNQNLDDIERDLFY